MFSKLFKYDFHYVFRFWWIFAVASVGLSLVGGFLVRALVEMYFANIENFLLELLCILGLFAVVVVLCFFPAAAIIGCLIRYYKNFFSDEGYLTFTLPVSRTTLLNSKIVNYITFSLISLLVLLIDALIIAFIGSAEGTIHFFKELGHSLFYLDWNGQLIAFVILIPIFLIVALVMGVCIYYLSITIGSIISKKHKVLTGIGVYYGINMVLSGIQQIFWVLTMNTFYTGTAETIATFTLYLLFSTILYTMLGVAAYCVNLYCIKNKLNLN
ncbi:MAG: hypothetical protein IJ374_02485 [Lachnospiraceae bacterium]|nr:hypothetical protein [Lachnospiraceae bacterium]